MAAPSEVTVRIVSLNAWGVPLLSDARQARMRALGPALAALRPQLVTLQEVWTDDDADVLGAALASAGLPHQQRRTSNGWLAGGSAGLMIASAHPIEETAFVEFDVGRQPHTPWHLDWMVKKGALAVRVRTELGVVQIVDTHLQASYRTGNYVPVRLAQAIDVAAMLCPGDPVVLAGDLNSPSTELPFRALAAAASLRPTAPRADDDVDIDAVLVRDGAAARVDVLAMRHVFTEDVRLDDGTSQPLSDHTGVLVDLRLTPAASASASASAATRSDDAWHRVAPEVDAAFAHELTRTSRQRWLALAVLLLAALATAHALRRAPKTRRRRWILAAAVPVAAWCTSFAFWYAPAQLAGIARARALAAAHHDASGAVTSSFAPRPEPD